MKGVFDTTQEHSQSYPFHKDKNDKLKVNFEIADKIQTKVKLLVFINDYSGNVS